MSNSQAVIFIILALIIAIAAPLATIASINILFGTMIPFTPITWLAAFWLTGLFAAQTVSK